MGPSKITTMEEARKHRTYALVILMLVYAFNFIDRRILSILQTPIKEEFNLSDGQLGLLTGFLFALLYTVVGIPLARVADSTNRKTVITWSLTVWSGFTAISGLVMNYWQLALARMGVGVGEAGGSPPAHAIVSDLYEPEKRARALAIYSSGIYIGTLLGNVGGGWISDAFNWRTAFMVVGIPGILLAILMHFTMREPMRGLSGLKPSTEKVTFLQSFKHLWGLKSFRYFSVATGLGTFVTYGIGDWMVPFMERSHGMSRTEIGFTYGMIAGIAGAIGTIGGGMFADWLGKRDKRWQLWVPMWGKVIGGPIFIFGLITHEPWIALTCYGIGLVLAAAYLGPSLAVTHSLVPPGMRAMSSAVLFLILNIIGLGLGPLLVGQASDFLNDASACNLADQAVQLAKSCPRVEDVYTALQAAGATTAKTLSEADLSAAIANGFQMGDLAKDAGLHGNLAFSLRNAFPAVTGIGIGVDSLRWAMIACVIFAYPFSILWHLGAQALPKPTEIERDATEEALTRGDTQPGGKTS
ncbi:MAG: MFS transporter [Hyphomonadaceae bacterium]|nr:MFS transporter [Hyphomonadaceae bacterium]